MEPGVGGFRISLGLRAPLAVPPTRVARPTDAPGPRRLAWISACDSENKLKRRETEAGKSGLRGGAWGPPHLPAAEAPGCRAPGSLSEPGTFQGPGATAAALRAGPPVGGRGTGREPGRTPPLASAPGPSRRPRSASFPSAASEAGLPASGLPWPPGASSSLGRALLRCGLAERSLCSPRRCFFWPPAASSFGFLTSRSLWLSQVGAGPLWGEGSEGGAGCDGENGERMSSRETPTSGRPGAAAAAALQAWGSSADTKHSVRARHGPGSSPPPPSPETRAGSLEAVLSPPASPASTRHCQWGSQPHPGILLPTHPTPACLGAQGSRHSSGLIPSPWSGLIRCQL